MRGLSVRNSYGVKGRGSGLTKRRSGEQNDCLRLIMGAYKSTPVAVLEELIDCPLINLVLAKKVARFRARAVKEKSGA